MLRGWENIFYHVGGWLICLKITVEKKRIEEILLSVILRA